MPRTSRASVGGVCFHVINRGNRRAAVFLDDADYTRFMGIVAEATERTAMRVLAYCLMPNHFHFVVRPPEDGDLSRWMQWLLTTHVRRHHRRYKTDGRIWQGRFKAFPIQQDEHLLTVMRYVERNPLRSGLVKRAEDWKWSSLSQEPAMHATDLLHESPVPRYVQWSRFVNEPQSADELKSIRRGVNHEIPYGCTSWVQATAERLGLRSDLRRPGRLKRG